MRKVDWTKWSAIAEISSAIAIVMTLLYLSVQTRYLAEQTEQTNLFLQQNQDIALADGISAAVQRQYLIADVIGQAPDVWVKGLAGQELSVTERVHFVELADAHFLSNFSAWSRSLAIGNRQESADRWVRELALDLYIHPGLKEYWDSAQERYAYTQGASDSEFDDLVNAEFDALKQRGGIP